MDFDFLTKRDDNIKWIPAILKCKCGEEWTNERSRVKEGKDPYIEMECRECETINANKRSEERKRHAKEKRLNQLDESLPPRFRGKLKDPLNDKLLDSICSIVHGDFGSGKTWECYAVARKLLELGLIKKFKLVTEVSLLNDLKADFDYMSSKIESYQNIDLLIIDEAGKNQDSVFNKAQLFDILNHRYEWEKKTILICNTKKKEDLYTLFPTAILDRFRECVVEMTGQSLRYKE
jgi:hypothetical protein